LLREVFHALSAFDNARSSHETVNARHVLADATGDNDTILRRPGFGDGRA
jgi:hypothetical protein